MPRLKQIFGGILGDVERIPVAGPTLTAAVKSGEEILTREHLKEIKMRRAVADIDTLIGACEKFLTQAEAKAAKPTKKAS